MKNNYDIVDEQAFDENSLIPGEIGVEVISFEEGNNKGEPIIRLGLKIFWAADEENEQFIEKEFQWSIFFGAKNTQTPRIWKGVFKKANFEVDTWVKDSDFPPKVMLPGALKLLAYKRVPLIVKIAAGKGDTPRNFVNIQKIARADPVSGQEYPDALPDPVPNALVLEAYNAVLETENTSDMV